MTERVFVINEATCMNCGTPRSHGCDCYSPAGTQDESWFEDYDDYVENHHETDLLLAPLSEHLFGEAEGVDPYDGADAEELLPLPTHNWAQDAARPRRERRQPVETADPDLLPPTPPMEW